MGRFLITEPEEMKALGWEELDFVLISGDAYVDHPSFAPAVIGRFLEKKGYRVGIIDQPDWHDVNAFKKLGKPRLASLVTAGNLDSMLNKFTAAKKMRREDDYSPGGETGHRPDRATLVYSNRMKEAFSDVPVVIGGIEASLRRFGHYDYWSDTVRRSILVDAKADILVYGMGEKQIVEIAEALDRGTWRQDLPSIRGICYMAKELPQGDYVLCPSFEEIKEDKMAFADAFRLQYDEQDPYYGRVLVQGHGDRYLIQNTPALPLTQEEMDDVYDLPYMRTWHPKYDAKGGVPALAEVQFSLVSQRGCFGSCSFCAITNHQGRIIQNRSHESLIQEAQAMINLDNFKGYIHDVGGPSANFRHLACDKQAVYGACRGRTCAAPEPCDNLNTSHDDYVALLRKIRKLKGVKKVFVRSGLRYDYVLADNNKAFVKELCEHHVSGQLKVAPEHVSKRVTTMMGKAGKEEFLKFKEWFDEANRQLGKKQYLVPYFMSSHPGCTLEDAIELAEFLRDQHMYPEQVQDFIPTPGSLSTCMYYTGINPLDGKPVYVAKKGREKAMQRALMQYKNMDNYDLVKEALIKANRRDLIGFGPECLIPPRPIGRNKAQESGRNSNRKPLRGQGKQGQKTGERRGQSRLGRNEGRTFTGTGKGKVGRPAANGKQGAQGRPGANTNKARLRTTEAPGKRPGRTFVGRPKK